MKSIPLILEKPYRTGPMASTDLHAGGVFFCVVYRECLEFEAGGRVRWWRELLDTSMPYNNDLDEFRSFSTDGSYGLNNRNYLVCKFPNLELTGLPCKDAPALLAFHVWYPSSKMQDGRVFHAPEPTAKCVDGKEQPETVLSQTIIL